MYVDKNLVMADSRTMSSASTDVDGLTTVYLGAGAYRDIGKGKPVAVVIVVETAFASAGSATEQFKVIGHTGADIAGAGTVIAETGAIAYTSLTKGKVIAIPIPAGIMGTTLVYLGVRCTTAGATSTNGVCSAFLALDW